MRSFLKKISAENTLIEEIIRKGILLRNVIVPIETRLKQRFKRKLGYELNLENPETYNEKIQWLKLHDKTPLHTICADKYAVRNHVKSKIGEKYLIPLILQTTNTKDILPENLPEFPIIIKTNHDSSGGTFIWDKNEIDWQQLRKDFDKRLSINYDYGKGEWQYKNIPPCIIAEKLLIDKDGNIPVDYKLHCFNGKLAFTQVDIDRSFDHKRNLYDVDWQFIDCKWVYDNGRQIDKPKVYDEMRSIAEKFAEDFIYVRVDLYNIGKEIYFGELTFHSESGNGKFYPEIWDKNIGSWLKLPIQ